MKKTLLFVLMLCSVLGYTQEKTGNYKKKRVAVKDSIKIDSVSINPSKFIVKTKDGKVVDTTLYTIDYVKAVLKFKQPFVQDSVEIEYLQYPKFLTKVYKQLDDQVIVDRSSGAESLYKLQNTKRRNNFTPFDGLTTSGSISRGVTIGNNQNSVLNSELDLQISNNPQFRPSCLQSS